MELVSHVIPAKTGEEILLMPLGDVQWAGHEPEVAMAMLARHVKWGVERGAWFLGMGDYIDYMSPSNRERYNAAGLYDTTRRRNDDSARGLVEDLYLKALKPSKGRWLGLLEGHHYHEYRDGTTSDQDLASRLDAPFLGTCAFVRLVVKDSSRGSTGNVVVWCHHGVGSGTTLAAPLNKLERLLEAWEADIYLMGHMHRKVAGPIDRVEPVWSGRRNAATLMHRTKIIACTGSFLKAYTKSDSGPRTKKTPAALIRGGYVEQGMMRPTALGGVLVKIRPRWSGGPGTRGRGWNPDINVEL